MKKIFIIDDNMACLKKAVDNLESAFEVHRCQSVEKATRLLKSNKYDLFVIDIMMPTRGLINKDEFKAGFNFFLEKVTNTHPNVPILFWSNLSEASFNTFKASNPNIPSLNFLHKTDDNNELLNEVKKILK